MTRMRKLFLSIPVLVLLLLLASPCLAQLPGYNNFCQLPGKKVVTQGVSSTTLVPAIYPKCTVTVFNTGTVTLSTINSTPGGGALSNPFQANVDGSFLFFASGSLCYDVTISASTSGGTPVMPGTFTYTDVCPGGNGGGGGGGGLSDPGGNGVVFRSALNTTRVSTSADIIGLWTGTCNLTTFFRGDGQCQPVPGSGLSGMTGGQVPIAASANTINSSKPIQGSADPNILGSGTVSGTGAVLCTDANGGATTTGCPAGGISGATAGQVLVATGANTGTSYAGFTSDTSGNITANSVTTLGAGGNLIGITSTTTSPTLVTSAFNLVAPNSASITAYGWQFPTAETATAAILKIGGATSHVSALSYMAMQGTDSNLLTSGTVAGTGATLCTDANGGATTAGCATGGLSGMTAGQVPIAASSSTVTSSKPIQGTDANIMSAGTVGGTGLILCASANGGATTSNCNAVLGLPNTGSPALVADYAMPASEVSTTTLTDYSGNGNNGTFPGGANNPTRLATGGLQFVASSNQFISLPAATATNGCQSWAFATSMTLPLANTNALLVQTTSFSASQVFGIGFNNTTPAGVMGSDKHYTDVVTGIVENAGDGSTVVQHPGQGIHIIITSSGTGAVDAIYIDGVPITQYLFGTAVTGSANRWNAAGWRLGGNNAGFTGWYNGNIYRAACWNGQLSPVQAQQAYAAIYAQLSQELAPPVPLNGFGYTVPAGTWPSSTDVTVVDGDSIFSGADATLEGLTGWSSQLQLQGNPTQQLWVPATVGTFLQQQQYNNINSLDSYYNADGTRNTYLIGGGFNDIGHGPSIYALMGSVNQMCKQKHVKGFKCLVGTINSQGAGATVRNNYNALLRQHWAEFADGFMDYGGDPVLGCDSCNASPNMAGVHPSIWSGYMVGSYYMQRAINRLHGPQDFTNAPTFASVPGASTATTNATDGAQVGSSGQSLATYTFGSNPFNTMGPKGNGLGVSVTCTGITPAGYNTTFTTLSSTATQITGYIPTFGLAAQSVAGTCSAAPQADSKYVILNVGAVNWPLDTACGYTGQRVYLRNINAGTTTATTTSMPGESAETITGAATIPQNTTAIFEAVTTGLPSTPQCGWVRIAD